MLNKLLKHEFRATGRIMLPTLGALLLLSVMAGISLRIMSGQSKIYWVFRMIMRLLQGAFFMSLFAVCVLVVVLIVIRFYRSLMGDEGYLSFTLPVSVDGHLWNKMITSLVWLVAVVLVCGISVMLFFAIGGTKVFSNGPTFGEFIRECNAKLGVGNMIGFTLEGILAAAMACFSLCLHFYAAIAIGGTAAKSKKLVAVVFYFVLSAARNVIALLMIPVVAGRGLWQWLDVSLSFNSVNDVIPTFHVICSACVFVLAVLSAIYYIIARICMTKKLNLA